MSLTKRGCNSTRLDSQRLPLSEGSASASVGGSAYVTDRFGLWSPCVVAEFELPLDRSVWVPDTR